MTPHSTILAPAGQPSHPPKAGGDAVAWVVLRGLARRWRQVVGIGGVAAVVIATAVWVFLPPPVPSATAKLYIPLRPATNLGGEHPDPPIERQTQATLIKSRLALTAALRSPEVNSLPVIRQQDDAPDWLAKKLTVEFEGPEILKVTLQYSDPEQARIVVDAVKDGYLKEIVNNSVYERGERLRRLGEMEAATEATVTRKRNAIRELAKELGATDPQNVAHQQRLVLDQLQAARTELVKLQAELRRGRLEEASLAGRAGTPGELPESVVDGYVNQDPRVRASDQARAQLEAKLEATRGALATPGHPRVAQLAGELEKHKADHEALRARVRAEVTENGRGRSRLETDARLASVREQNAFRQGLEKVLTDEVERLGKSAKTINTMNLDLEPQRVELKQLEDILFKIKQTAAVLGMERDTPARVRELEKAVVSKVDPERQKALLAAGGGLAALALTALLVGLVEFRRQRVDSPEGVSRGLGLRVVGTVPDPRPGGFPWLRADRDRYAAGWLTEAISCTRIMLLNGRDQPRHRVLQITSPVSGEGKTSLSIQLAADVARAGHRTLLLDADLRNPNVHTRLGLPPAAGLCEILRGETDPAAVVRETAVPGLMFLPAGAWTPDTPQALATADLARLFAAWRDEYAFVLIDSSPVLPVTDPLVFALHADGVIVSLLRGVSRMPLAAEACHRMTALGVRLLGVIVNGTPARVYGYSAPYIAPTRA